MYLFTQKKFPKNRLRAANVDLLLFFGGIFGGIGRLRTLDALFENDVVGRGTADAQRLAEFARAVELAKEKWHAALNQEDDRGPLALPLETSPLLDLAKRKVEHGNEHVHKEDVREDLDKWEKNKINERTVKKIIKKQRYRVADKHGNRHACAVVAIVAA